MRFLYNIGQIIKSVIVAIAKFLYFLLFRLFLIIPSCYILALYVASIAVPFNLGDYTTFIIIGMVLTACLSVLLILRHAMLSPKSKRNRRSNIQTFGNFETGTPSFGQPAMPMMMPSPQLPYPGYIQPYPVAVPTPMPAYPQGTFSQVVAPSQNQFTQNSFIPNMPNQSQQQNSFGQASFGSQGSNMGFGFSNQANYSQANYQDYESAPNFGQRHYSNNKTSDYANVNFRAQSEMSKADDEPKYYRTRRDPSLFIAEYPDRLEYFRRSKDGTYLYLRTDSK